MPGIVFEFVMKYQLLWESSYKLNLQDIFWCGISILSPIASRRGFSNAEYVDIGLDFPALL